MTIRKASTEDLTILTQYDRHISAPELENLIRLGRVDVLELKGQFAGWLRWNLFWDNTPFLNMLFVLEPFRGKGYGKQMMLHWQQQMGRLGFDRVMTSTASDEYAQHFYGKLGYGAVGGFSLPGESYELIFCKLL